MFDHFRNSDIQSSFHNLYSSIHNFLFMFKYQRNKQKMNCIIQTCIISTADTDLLKMVPVVKLLNLKLFLFIPILKISSRNCVSSLLSAHYRTFLFTGQFDLTKTQKSRGTHKFYRVSLSYLNNKIYSNDAFSNHPPLNKIQRNSI